MRSILLQIIREHGYEVGTWLQGFINALPPLED
jgi:hypothetical protein